jgi:hypothetical protein
MIMLLPQLPARGTEEQLHGGVSESPPKENRKERQLSWLEEFFKDSVAV